MEDDIRSVFDVLASGLQQEAKRVTGYPTARPLLRYAGVSGLAARSEAHVSHVIASALDEAGFKSFVDEPYFVEHRESIRKFDLRIVLAESERGVASRFLTLEIKCFTLIDRVMGGMLRDVQKIKNVLSDEYAVLNVPIGLLVVGFCHDGRDAKMRRRYESFAQRAEIAEWLHMEHGFEIVEGQSMRHCLIDLWCVREPIA